MLANMYAGNVKYIMHEGKCNTNFKAFYVIEAVQVAQCI